MTASEPIDLRSGDRFRITSEETAIKGGKWDPWLAQIRCRYGHIYPHGGDALGVAVDSGRVIIAGRIRKLPFVEVTQDGDGGELNAVFHRRDLETVLEIMRPYRRKQFSEETLAKFRENLAKMHASRLSAVESTPEAQLGPSGTLQGKSIDFGRNAILEPSRRH